MPEQSWHILITLRSGDYYRFVQAIVEEIARRGGRVTLVAPEPEMLARALGGRLPESVSLEATQPNRHWSAPLLRVTREARSYLHWLRLRAQPDFLLERWLDYLPRPVRRLLRGAQRLGLGGPLTHPFVLGALAWLEAATPPGRNIRDHLRAIQPDLALLTPLLYPGAWEVDYLKACRRLGLANAALVASWDNLTSKGVFHVRPDTVLVWNQTQVGEAARYHGLPASRVIATGAAVFDWMFEDCLIEKREAFCAGAGLDPALPYVVYAVSSSIQHGDETEIVRNLNHSLGSLAPGRVQLLVRPHPRNATGWASFEAPGVRVQRPPAGAAEAVKRDLLNTLSHSAAVIGLNTTVFLEAAILDRPCVTLLFDDRRQAGWRRHTDFPHFRYLLDGAFLETANDEYACAEIIAQILQGCDAKQAARRAFVSRFVRPRGMEQPVAGLVVRELESLANASARPT